MPYTATNWVDNVTLGTHVNMNNLETQYTEATSSFNQDQYTPFILSGLIASKDSVTASKLDITAGVAYPLQADSTTRRRAIASTSQTTSALSSTYYLYVQPDGTLYWATTNTPATNSLFLAQVTTDSSGNIASVTDKRTLSTTLFNSKDANLGALTLPAPLSLKLTQNPSLTATVNGGVTFGQAGALAADYDGAALFNGSTGYLSMPTSGFPTGAGAVSLECWVKMAAYPGANGNILAIGTGGAGATLTFFISSAGVSNFSTNSVGTSTTTLALNTWYHLVGTYDGTNLRYYVNGALIGVATAATLNLSYGVALPASVGAEGGASAINFVNATIDEVAIYNAALSSTRITAHYNGGTSGGYSSAVLADAPLRYYRLGDAAGATFAADTITPAVSALVDAGGTLKNIGGQATVGIFGAPVIVAQAIAVNVTNTTALQVLTYTPPAAGVYRVNLHVAMGNGSNAVLDAHLIYTDGSTGNQGIDYFAAVGSGTMLPFGTATFTTGRYYAAMPITVYAKAGSFTFAVWYQDQTGTPNDYVTVVVERLS